MTATPTEAYWHPKGAWKCVCLTPTHARGQRFTQPQCAHCVYVKEPGTVESHTYSVERRS
jgi:hypothetical protein